VSNKIFNIENKPVYRSQQMAECKRILFLAANPDKSAYLRLHEEEREIRERLRLAGYGKTPIYSTPAARTRDVQQAMVDFDPHIVHFSGHGLGQDGLVFEDVNGQPQLVSSEALANLFELFSDQVECVILNACYSEAQAQAISQHIQHVVGMSQAIGDKAAIEFSVGFYTALGAGRPYEFSYRLGCNAIQLTNRSGHLTPVLLKNPDSFKSSNHDSPPQVSNDLERFLKLRVHRAVFLQNMMECYFVNLTNLSRNRALEVTHIWYEDDEHFIALNQPLRQLPVRLELDQSWETWIPVANLPKGNRDNAYQNFRARISTGAIFKSEFNPDVPPFGTIPGGPI
jgi:hypothetical protein